ncbi:MAG: 50S ribosomal protein L10 [Thermoleophilaceae bacterium]|nr:50S ribosomal protein L10 [Thermoleophilaceae bacterium]
MNRDQKAAVIEEVANEIRESEAVIAVDYRGISVPQAAALREKLTEAGARFRVVKNTLTIRAADEAGAESLKALLEGPTAFTFVRGDVALAAKALSNFRRETDLLEFKGGTMNGAEISIEEIQSIARLPSTEVLHGQLVGMLASPITGVVRGLNALLSGVAIQLGKIAEQGLIGGDAPAPEPKAEEPAAEEPAADEPEAASEEPAAEETTSETEEPSEAPGDPALASADAGPASETAEGEAAEEESEKEDQ